MNTPAHIAASLLVWNKEPGWRGMLAVGLGAALPDLPMFGFYAYQKIIGSSEHQIWSSLYFESSWQLLFDSFNSIPFALVAAAMCFLLRQPLGVIVAMSAMLHMLCDLPVHHDDAHRHFLPLSWRFESPISYWDPAHYGHIFAIAEFLFGIGVSGCVALRAPYAPMRWAARLNFSLYVTVLLLVAGYWTLTHWAN